MMKKLLFAVLALALVLTILPALDADNDAHATIYKACSQCDCTNSTKPYGTCECGHGDSKHTIKWCDHAKKRFEGTKDADGHMMECTDSKCPDSWPQMEPHTPDANGKCTICGYYACTHSEIVKYVEWYQGDCTKEGYTHTQCADPSCGLTDDWGTEPAKAAHAWKNDGTCAEAVNGCEVVCNHEGATEVVTDPTCSTEGYTTKTCSICGNMAVTDHKDALSHDWSDKTGICKNDATHVCDHAGATKDVTDPTCTEDGYTTTTCATCGNVTVTPGATELGHEWLSTGLCVRYTVCGATCTHNYEHKVTTPATCKEYEKTVETCSVCTNQKTTYGTEYGSHTWNANTGKCTVCDEECQHTWNVNTGKCTLCDAECPHTEMDLEHIQGSCYTYPTEKKTCKECGYVTTTQYGELEAHRWNADGTCKTEGCTAKCPHATIVEKVTEPTCTAAGYTKKECVSCDYEEIIPGAPKLSHKWGANGCEYGCGATCDHNYTEVTTPATCTAPAKTVKTCGKCGDTVTTTGTELAAHKYVKTTVPATCEEPAQVTETCSACGDTKTYSEGEVDLTKHVFEEIERKAATCAKPEQVIERCTVCYEKKTTEVGEKTTDHKWVVFGFGAGYCTVCGEITTDDDEVFPDGKECIGEHGYDANTGLCVNCGAKQPESDCEHEWTKFSFGGWICNKCQLITINNPHPDHQLPEGDPNCEHNWVQATYSGWVCSKCGAMTINQPGCQHEKTSTLVYDASCVEPGWTKTYCMNTQCTKVLEQTVLPIDKDAHGEKKTETVAATCQATGYIKVSCSLCEKVLKEIILPIGDHDWVDGVCSVCGTKQIKTKYYYNNTMCSFGPTTRELVGGNDWYRVTPIDLSVDGVYTYDLVASNRYIVGKVTITVANGALTVDYSTNNSEVVVKEETLLFYASKADLAVGNAVVAEVGEAIDIAGTFGEDTKVIVSLILIGDYNALGWNVSNLAVDTKVIADMIAIMD